MFSSLMESTTWAQCLPLHSSSGFIPLLLNLNRRCLGKTSLLCVFANGALPNEFVPAIFQSYVADLELDGRQVEIALWDTVDQEDYDRLRPLSYSNSHVILICYAIDTPESLTSVTERASSNPTSSAVTLFETDTRAWQWIAEASYAAPKVPVLLVGCRKDLRHDHRAIEQLRRENQSPLSPEQV
jgi:Ras family protein A